MKIAYIISLYDSRSNLVRELSGRANSLLKNYYLALYTAFTCKSSTLVDSGGNTFTHDCGSYSKWYNLEGCYGMIVASSLEGDSRQGILIGTSDTPVTPDDYNLGNKFSCWCSKTFSSFYEENGSVVLEFRRVFLNDNVETDIKEFGLMARIRRSDDALPVTSLILREVVSPISFPLDYSLVVKIKFTF